MFDPKFYWKRYRFTRTLSKAERKRWCLKHFVRKQYLRHLDDTGCEQCADQKRVDEAVVEKEMAYYNLALRDRELADAMLEDGTLVPAGQPPFPLPLIGQDPMGQVAGDIAPDERDWLREELTNQLHQPVDLAPQIEWPPLPDFTVGE